MSGEISLHRLEEYGEAIDKDNKAVLCSVNTKRFGYLQVEYKNIENGGWKLSTPPQEPDLNMLTSKQTKRVELICAIVYRLTFDVPAAKERLP